MTYSQRDLVKIGSQIVEDTGSEIRVSYQIDSSFLPEELWFTLDTVYRELINESSDAALIALLVPIMSRNSDIEVLGDLSTKLLLSIQTELMAVLSIALNMEPINVTCSGKLHSNCNRTNEFVATGFSGGVDSYCILQDYFYNDNIPANSKITHLIFNNVGANGATSEVVLFLRRYEKAKEAAQMIGLPLVKVNSNLDDFFVHDPSLNFCQTHSLRNASVAVLLSRGIKTYRYASTYTYEYIYVRKIYDTAYFDPITLPMLSTENIDIQSNGSMHSRPEKTALIMDNEIVQKNLHVCVDHDSERNCSKCQKCMRTMLTLDLLGKLQRFDKVFNIKHYRNNLDSYLTSVLTSNNCFNAELRELIKQTKLKIPPLVQLKAQYLNTRNLLKNSVKSLLRISS